jgi:hypothetical protein
MMLHDLEGNTCGVMKIVYWYLLGGTEEKLKLVPH